MGESREEYFERLCKDLYESTSPQDRSVAEKTLLEFSESSDCLQQCMILLERGKSSYAQFVACTTLLKAISKSSSAVTLSDRIELRNYLLNYMVSRPKLPQFVLASLCQLFARLTKIGWFDFNKEDEFVFRSSVDEIFQLAQGSLDMCTLAVQLFGYLVTDFNQNAGITSISKHRRIAGCFRDLHLFDIFKLSIRLLKEALDNIKTMDLSNENQQGIVGQLLSLSLSCLSYDFIGSVCDDSTDESFAVQVPTGWRVAFLDTSILKMFFSLFRILPSSLATVSLSCIIQLSSIRRTIFNNSERQEYLSALAVGVKDILENPQVLSEQSVYHEFCRLITRLKSNYQLSELIKVPDYPKIIRMIAEFTVNSLGMFQFSTNSIHYLLAFWQRMVSSQAYIKSDENHYLQNYAPGVAKAYVESRLNIVSAVINDGIDDPIDDHTSLTQQLEQLSVICRCEYETFCQMIISLFNEMATRYQTSTTNGVAPSPKLAPSQTGDEPSLASQEGCLSWLIFICGAAIAGRASFYNTGDEQDETDGYLICRVFQLMRYTDSRLPTNGVAKIELGYLWFLEQFRKIYISDQISKVMNVYKKLDEVLGVKDETMVLAIFARKIITNLKYWSSQERIIDETLALLNDLSIGYASVKKLVRLDEIQFLFNNHTSEHFDLLGTSTNVKTMKCRSKFYTALTRLLTLELQLEDEDQFQQYMMPMTTALDQLQKLFTSMPDSSLVAQTEAKKAVIGLARDIHGIAFASNSKSAYHMLFNWIFPDYFQIFHKSIELWYADPDLTTPVLKMVSELCQNRSQRLNFDVTSPNAYLMFKEASKMICTYGSRMLAISDIPKDQFYRLRLKGITICFGMLKSCLCGCYVNFGVFRLYGDTSVDDGINMFIQMLLAVPQQDLQAYSKLSLNYYYLLECLAQDHMAFISHLEPQIFLYVLQTIHEGVTALDSMICTGCCTTLDYIVTYLYMRLCRARSGKPARDARHIGIAPQGDNCIRTLEQHPEIFQQILATLLGMIMWEDCRNQWSLSRPLLGLILLNETYFSELRDQVINSQPELRRPKLAAAFRSLMEGIERSVSIKCKDRFTQNLSQFRRDIAECLKGDNDNQISNTSANNTTAMASMPLTTSVVMATQTLSLNNMIS